MPRQRGKWWEASDEAGHWTPEGWKVTAGFKQASDLILLKFLRDIPPQQGKQNWR